MGEGFKVIINILGFNWMAFLLTALTCFLVSNDKAFSKLTRAQFQIALISSFYLSLISQHLSLPNVKAGGFTQKFVFISEVILQPVIIILLILLFVKLHRHKTDYVFAIIAIVTILTAFLTHLILKDHTSVNGTLCVIVSVYYYYCIMQIFKKDRLTKLLLRHNLMYEMDDLINKSYDIVLIDVDNFKIINDKYGHDRGDEVLVTIVDTVNEYLPKGCKFYRYGGDEFVVISKKISTDELYTVFEKINSALSSKELRISYGIVRHNPGDDNQNALTQADKLMYENKKLIKSEDIWDVMTGLFNYRGFLDELDMLRRSADKEKHKIALVAIDIDRLSNINMAYGYTEGNLVIKVLSRIIKSALAGNEFIGHLGSDEFITAIECKDENDIRISDFIEQVIEGLGSAYEFAGKDYTVKLDVGKYIIPSIKEASTEECVNNVLYVKQEEKESRRKNDLSDDSKEFDDKDEKQVIDILDNNKLKYAFQPIVSAKTGDIVAYETLMRSDTDTMVSPLKILKYAEKNKRSYDVEKLTFFNVFERINSKLDFPNGARLFINSIPGFMLKDEDYEILKEKYGSFFKNMVIEITEQREVDDDSLATLNTRRDKDGFNLAIDDYGSGYSNTSSLLRYMPQVVKIDRLLITGIDRNAKKQFFVNSIISFAKENDMKILAEGVETENELKTVIRLGVDMIQGYFTAKPSLDIITEIPEDIKKLIITENLRVGSSQRMIYTASESCELSVVQLAMEDYSKINISGEYVRLVGNAEYSADMVIRIKDGANTHLTLSNVNLNSVDDEPCIRLGENSKLILNIEGNNRFNTKGIFVPEGSELTVIGPGNLDILAKGHECYAIGVDTETEYGAITLRHSGTFNITVDGENCVGIGGGVVGNNSAIDISSGTFNLTVAGVHAVGIGAYKGDANINLAALILNVEFRVNEGLVIGTLDGTENVTIDSFDININGSGKIVGGIGSINETAGNITMSSGSYKIRLNGQKLFLLGADGGELNIDINHAKLDVMGEGDNVLGFGTFDQKATLKVDECSIDLVINASSPMGFGLSHEVTGFKGKLATHRINGEVVSLGD